MARTWLSVTGPKLQQRSALAFDQLVNLGGVVPVVVERRVNLIRRQVGESSLNRRSVLVVQAVEHHDRADRGSGSFDAGLAALNAGCAGNSVNHLMRLAR